MTQIHFSYGRGLGALAAVAALVTATALPATADDSKDAHDKSGVSLQSDSSTTPEPINVDEIIDQASDTPGFTGKWFVEFSAEPTVNGGAVSTITAQQETFSNDVSDTGFEVEENFVDLWNGVTVSADN